MQQPKQVQSAMTCAVYEQRPGVINARALSDNLYMRKILPAITPSGVNQCCETKNL